MLSGQNQQRVKWIFFKDFYLFIFRARGRERESKGEKHQRVVASHTPATGDLAWNPGMYPDWESNRRPFGSQAGTQSTEPHQPGPTLAFFKENISIFQSYHRSLIIFPEKYKCLRDM